MRSTRGEFKPLLRETISHLTRQSFTPSFRWRSCLPNHILLLLRWLLEVMARVEDLRPPALTRVILFSSSRSYKSTRPRGTAQMLSRTSAAAAPPSPQSLHFRPTLNLHRRNFSATRRRTPSRRHWIFHSTPIPTTLLSAAPSLPPWPHQLKTGTSQEPSRRNWMMSDVALTPPPPPRVRKLLSRNGTVTAGVQSHAANPTLKPGWAAGMKVKAS